MEEQFQQVTNIINELAASNPYITKEQVAKARSMYNGDMRPIDEIRAELEAYSEEILANGLKREKGKELAAQRPEPIQQPMEPELEEEPRVQQIPQVQQEEVIGALKVELPGEEKQRALQSMIDEALGEPSNSFEQKQSNEQQATANKDQAKVLVKQQNEQVSNTSDSSSSEAGYGNVTALLSLTIICSIITIIIALLTILSN